MPCTGASNPGDDIRHRLAGYGPLPACREGQHMGAGRFEQVLLFDHVLGADLACGEAAGADPATDRLRITVHAPSGFRNCHHLL